MKYNFAQQGVCSTNVEFELDGDIVRNVSFSGGCNGNLKALSALVVTERLRGITCGFRKTSCSDQFAQALEKAAAEEKASAE